MAWWMATAWAVTLGTVPVSGQVTGADGLPLEGTHTVTVSLYDAASGGAPWWDDDQSVAFVGGAFQVLLGAGPTALDIEAFAAHGPPWVSVAVDGVASERVATGWVPRAAVAFRADSA